MAVDAYERKSPRPKIDMNLIRYCACGCGQQIKIKRQHRWEGIPKFIISHHNGLTPDIDCTQIIFCKCGCGEQIKLNRMHKHNGIPEYISGHNMLNKEVITWNANTAKYKDLVKIPKFCKCGCGEPIKILKGHRSMGVPEYIIKCLDFGSVI